MSEQRNVGLRDACRMAEQDRGDAKIILSLLDALEQAQKERDSATAHLHEANDTALMAAAELDKEEADHAVLRERLVKALRHALEEGSLRREERDQAQKDAKDARTLLGEAAEALSIDAYPPYVALRTRINATLTPQDKQLETGAFRTQ